jgi:hypothetical protein
VTRLAVPLLAASLVVVPVAAAAPVEPLPPPRLPAVTEVVPGVGYEREVRAGGEVVHVVRARTSPRISLAPVLLGGSPSRRGQLASALAARADSGAIAGINGDLFNLQASYPSGIFLTGGDLVSEPLGTRSALVLRPGNAIDAIALGLEGRFQAIDPTGARTFAIRAFAGINRPAQRGSETLLYTPSFGTAATPTAGSRYEVRVRLDQPGPLAPNVPRTGTVVGTRSGGGTAIGADEVVIAGVGSAGPPLVSELPLGQEVGITPGVVGLPPDAVGALGGGPVLVRDGSPVRSSGEGFSSSQLGSRTSRSAIGQTADGTILLVTAEGPSQGCPGITVAEQAELMADLGARTAIAMDGGGSAQLAVGPQLVIPWSSPRSLTDALVMSYDGVRLEPLPFRISANADRVDDTATAIVRATRAGTARVTIARRTGRPAKRLWQGRLGPGAATAAIDPRTLRLADGVYTVVARHVPDDGAATEQRRRVILDRTLGSLSARPVTTRVGRRKVQTRVNIGFVLAHPARVTVRIHTLEGAPLTTIASGRPFRPGRQRLTWDRKVRKTVVSGTVQVRVEARSRFGISGLARDVTLKPIPKPPPRRG